MGRREDESLTHLVATTATVVDGPPTRRSLLDSGERVAHFVVERTLGRGGMGEVFLARDERLERSVALKMIHREVLADEGMRQRFLGEARTTARFNHPNIVGLYDVGEHRGMPYLVLEYLDGPNLRERLADRPLELEEIRVVATAVADALAEAHRRGVLHLDLKPANVLLPREGPPRVLDFGLARGLDGAAAQRVSAAALQLSSPAGTPVYMAPEQWRGEAGAPVDVWAFGVLLYEMAAGKRPFDARDAATLAYRIGFEEPEPLPPTLPQGLCQLARRCLAKDAAARPTAAECAAELRHVFAPRPAARTSTPTLAVLPFADRGDAAEVADVLAEELTDVLSRMRDWRVLAAAATARYRDVDPLEAARALGAQAVVCGSVRLSGTTLRATARLLEAPSGTQLHSERVDCALGDLLAAEARLSGRFAEALRAELVTVPQRDEVPPEAMRLYLQARQKIRHQMVLREDGAVALLERCLELAPHFAGAVSQYSLACVRAWWIPKARNDRDWEGLARASVEEAMRVCPDLPETHVARGQLWAYDGEPARAAESYARALEIAPTCAMAHTFLAMLQNEAGRSDEGIKRSLLVADLDPTTFAPLLEVARARALRGDWDGSHDALEQAVLRAPRRHPAVCVIGLRIASWRRDQAEIEAWVEELSVHDGLQRDLGSVWVGLLRGELPVERILATIDDSRHARFRLLQMQLFAEAFAYAGASGEAVAQVMRAVDSGLLDIEWLDRCPLLDSLRHRPEIATARRRVRARAEAVWTGTPPSLALLR